MQDRNWKAFIKTCTEKHFKYFFIIYRGIYSEITSSGSYWPEHVYQCYYHATKYYYTCDVSTEKVMVEPGLVILKKFFHHFSNRQNLRKTRLFHKRLLQIDLYFLISLVNNNFWR